MHKYNFRYIDISLKIQNFLKTKKIDSSCSINLAGKAGSGRIYIRITKNSRSFILLISSEKDLGFNKFIELTKFYNYSDFPVPNIYCTDNKNFQILLEDLGDNRLLNVKKDPDLKYYKLAIDILIKLQSLNPPTKTPDTFNQKDLRWETNYFQEEYLNKYKMVKLTKIEKDILDSEFNKLSKEVASQPKSIIHRDFQSQNIMIQNELVKIIDYQDSRIGSIYYDLASLLFDPYKNLDSADIQELLEYYRLKSNNQLSIDEVYQNLLLTGAQRIMQAIGVYSSLTQNKGLTDFEQYIEPGCKRLRWILKKLNKKILLSSLDTYI